MPPPNGKERGPENRPSVAFSAWGCGNRSVSDWASPSGKTSRPDSGRWSSVSAARSKSLASPPSIPRFAIEHVAQSLTAQGTTEPLHGARRPGEEHLVATGTLAAKNREIVGNCRWALALARLHGRRFHRDRWLGKHHQGNPPPIPPALFPPANLPRFARPPAAHGLPPPPSPRGLAAGITAVTTLGMSRPVELLAPFEQATPTRKMT